MTCTCTASHSLIAGHILEWLLLRGCSFDYDIVLNVVFVVDVHNVNSEPTILPRQKLLVPLEVRLIVTCVSHICVVALHRFFLGHFH